MSNSMFAPGTEGLISGQIDLDTAVIKVGLVNGYSFSSAHKFVSDLTGAGGSFNGTPVALSSVSVTNGVLDAADSSITTTASVSNHVIVIYQASAVTGGSDVATSAQRLICYLDTGTGLPIQPGTGATPITWDNGTNKIVKFG